MRRASSNTTCTTSSTAPSSSTWPSASTPPRSSCSGAGPGRRPKMSVAVAIREQTTAPARSAEPPFSIEVLEGREAFNALEKEWNAALARGPRDEPMLRHEWVRAWIENFAPGAPLRTVVARAGRELHAAVPLVEQKGKSADTCFLPMTTWSLPHNDHSQRGGVLLGRRGKEALAAVWDKLAAMSGWDRLRVRDLPHGAPEWKLRDLAEGAGFPCGLWTSLRSPYLSLPAQYEQLEARVDAKVRQNLRRRLR